MKCDVCHRDVRAILSLYNKINICISCAVEICEAVLQEYPDEVNPQILKDAVTDGILIKAMRGEIVLPDFNKTVGLIYKKESD